MFVLPHLGGLGCTSPLALPTWKASSVLLSPELYFSKSTHQVFCKPLLNSGLSDAKDWMGAVYYRKNGKKMSGGTGHCMPLPGIPTSSTSDPGVLQVCYRIIVFSSVTNKYLGRNNL